MTSRLELGPQTLGIRPAALTLFSVRCSSFRDGAEAPKRSRMSRKSTLKAKLEATGSRVRALSRLRPQLEQLHDECIAYCCLLVNRRFPTASARSARARRSPR